MSRKNVPRWHRFLSGQKAVTWMALRRFTVAHDGVAVLGDVITVRPGETIPDDACCVTGWVADYLSDSLEMEPL